MGGYGAEFSDCEEGEAGVGELGVRGRGGGGGGQVDPVGHVQAGEEPVVGAVFEDVEGGHGGRAEAVDEEGFQFAFGEVEADEGEGEGLEGGGTGAVGCVGEDEVEERVDEEGT